jgi:hypothetical protein
MTAPFRAEPSAAGCRPLLTGGTAPGPAAARAPTSPTDTIGLESEFGQLSRLPTLDGNRPFVGGSPTSTAAHLIGRPFSRHRGRGIATRTAVIAGTDRQTYGIKENWVRDVLALSPAL